MGKSRGFTLVEVVIVIVIIGILAVTAIPKYVDLATSAKVATTQTSLQAIRSYAHMAYADRAMSGLGASFPASISASDFGNNNPPLNHINNKTGVETVASPQSGSTTSGSYGFWYMASDGNVGAYSDGTIDTTGW